MCMLTVSHICDDNFYSRITNKHMYVTPMTCISNVHQFATVYSAHLFEVIWFYKEDQHISITYSLEIGNIVAVKLCIYTSSGQCDYINFNIFFAFIHSFPMLGLILLSR